MLEIMSFIVCCMGCTDCGCNCGADDGNAACGDVTDTIGGAARVSIVPKIEDDVTFIGVPEGFCSVKFISARLVPVAIGGSEGVSNGSESCVHTHTVYNNNANT